MTTCQHDSGSMTGNRPMCSAEALHVVTYRNGSFGPLHVMVCARHVTSAEARAYPGHIATEAI